MGTAPSNGYSKTALIQWYMEGNKMYGTKGFELNSKHFRPSDIADMAGKVVLITGANKGLGFAAAKRMAELHATVHIVCRDEAKGREALEKIIAATNNSNVFCHKCDMSSYAAVRNFAKDFAAQVSALDVLINNAGLMPEKRTLTSEGNEIITATTLGGTHLLTDLLVPSLKATKGRVINVSSGGMYTVRANPSDIYNSGIQKYDGTLFYAFAKRIQVILTEIWAEKLKGAGVTVNAMHPGWATTEGVLQSIPGFHEQNKDSFRTVEQGADTIVFLASNKDRVVGQTGLFWFDRQPVRTHMPLGGTQSSEADRRLLWKVCCETVGGLTNA